MSIQIVNTNQREITLTIDGIAITIRKTLVTAALSLSNTDAVDFYYHDNVRISQLQYFEIDYNNVSSPVVGSAAALLAAILSYLEITTGDTWTVNEVPSGTIDGANTSFSTADAYVAGKLLVYYNGLRLASGDYSETGANTFSLNQAPQDGDVLIVDYIR